jgi:hypothetical protein
MADQEIALTSMINGADPHWTLPPDVIFQRNALGCSFLNLPATSEDPSP